MMQSRTRMKAINIAYVSGTIQSSSGDYANERAMDGWDGLCGAEGDRHTGNDGTNPKKDGEARSRRDVDPYSDHIQGGQGVP